MWVTGVAGTGKSTVCEVLQSRGVAAVDADDGLCAWVNRVTGEVAGVSPSVVPEGWPDLYSWTIDVEEVKRLIANVGAGRIFIFGTVVNESDLWEVMDGIVCLVADDATIERRLEERTGNLFGKSVEQRDAILGWNSTMEEFYRGLDAVLVDATQPVEMVADAILEAFKQR